MKKRILFVDDEELVLQGLQRTLRPLRNEWEMHFVKSGADALVKMSLAPFDIVVSDMRMPGMNGVEFLNEVMLRCPGTVRLVLSGHADRELALKCVGVVHQYLSKPCEAETLKATIDRVTNREASQENRTLMALVARLEKLPSLPSLYTEIIRCLQSPDLSMQDVGAIITKDIAMTAKVLKLVNSAFFGLGRRISNPGEAAAYLGGDVLKALVLSTDVFSQFEGMHACGFSSETLWRHSLETAAAAKAIAQAERAGRNIVDESFVAGMLHDTGKLMLAANFPERYSEALKLSNSGNLSLVDAERQVFGSSHADVGGYLLGLWGLPVPVVEAISLHHSPSASRASAFSALTATHVGNALAKTPNLMEEADLSREIDLTYLKALSLDERLPAWRIVLQEIRSGQSACMEKVS